LLQSDKENLGELPQQGMADTSWKAEAELRAPAGTGRDLMVAVGHEGKHVLRFDPQRSPPAAAMQATLQTHEGRAAYRRRQWSCSVVDARLPLAARWPHWADARSSSCQLCVHFELLSQRAVWHATRTACCTKRRIDDDCGR